MHMSDVRVCFVKMQENKVVHVTIIISCMLDSHIVYMSPHVWVC